MFLLIGKTVGVGERVVGNPGNEFSVTEITLVVGEGTHTAVQRVRVARDFPKSALPVEGEDVALHVVVSAYQGKSGAGYNVTALANVSEKFDHLV